MKKSDRFIALALCCTLTLGAFAYRPSEAKAIAGVDDAVVIGALLSAFAGGCGLIFSNNGMTSSELAQGLTDKWNEFNESAENAASSFAAWLGFEDPSALLGALSFSGGKLVIPRAIARKLSEFTTWLTQNLGVTAGGDSQTVVNHPATDSFILPNGNTFYLSNCTFSNIEGKGTYLTSFSPASSFDLSDFENSKLYLTSDAYLSLEVRSKELAFALVSPLGASYYTPFNTALFNTSKPFFLGRGVNGGLCLVFETALDSSYAEQGYFYQGYEIGLMYGKSYTLSDLFTVSQSPASRLSVFAPSYYKNPTIDLPTEGEEAASPTLSGVGDGTATSVEELLQKILAQLQANTLAPTLDLAGTETGGNTGTDEDAKPYLPYIPQIFEKIKVLPGTLANIWETVKGIPAAIAEKIGAFFTTLWGWLQSIIDAITALPAAIAEKIGALFKPDEALLTEITDAFKGKFGFFSTLKQFGNDLFGMTPETEPPVIWVHLENAESKFGYNYGDKQKIFDMTWYQKYKASVDGLLSGFLWLGYLWLLFKRAPAILGGMQLSADDAPRSADMPDVLSSPRLGAGDGSTMYRGDGFTMRDKGGRSK